MSIDSGIVTVKGPKGTLVQTLPDGVDVSIEGSVLTVNRQSEEKKHRSNHGLARSLINNMIVGVSKGFSKELHMTGVGYKANVAGDTLKMSLGFSHDIDFKIPAGISIDAKNNIITVSGFDKQQVGQVAANIRSYRKPEPYKGKGIRYKDEYIIRKAGKAAGA